MSTLRVSSDRVLASDRATSASSRVLDTGAQGHSLLFNNTSGLATIPHGSQLNITGEYTVCFWMRLNNISSPYGEGGLGLIFDKISAGTGLSIGVSTLTAFKVTHGSTTYTTSFNLYKLGRWEHIAISYIPSTDRITTYTNTISPVNTTGITVDPSTNSADMTIGNRAADDRTFNGNIYNLCIFNRNLTLPEIERHYLDRLDEPESEEMMDDCVFRQYNNPTTPTVVTDLSSYANHGTITSPAVVSTNLPKIPYNNRTNFSLRSDIPYDIILVAGQSNASGRGSNNQQVLYPNLSPAVFGNDYRIHPLEDPTDSGVAQVDQVSYDVATGSPWVVVANNSMAQNNRPVMIINGAKGGVSIGDWLAGADHTDRTTLYGSLRSRYLAALTELAKVGNSGVVRCVIWYQGETEANSATTQASYNANLDTVANTFASDYGVKLFACTLPTGSYTTQARINVINAAITEAWGDNVNTPTGADLSDQTTLPEDTTHPKTDEKIRTIGERMWTAIHNAGVL